MSLRRDCTSRIKSTCPLEIMKFHMQHQMWLSTRIANSASFISHQLMHLPRRADDMDHKY